MDQALALEILLDGHNALLTGPAGSGKTYVLNRFIREAKQEGKVVAVTATTGLAATHLNGVTIHAWSGIGVRDSLPDKHHEGFTQTRTDAIKNADVLIIDEISMLHDYRLDMINQVLQRVRSNNLPFGGVQVILCGDFFQLPPINKNNQPFGSFVVRSDAWRELDPVICYLTEQHRQKDSDFLDILSALRASDIRRRHAELLLERTTVTPTEDEEVPELHTTNIDVDRINNERLGQLKGKAHTFEMSARGKIHYVDNLKRACLATETLVLKKGALVMCIKNNPERRYVNGSIGEVVGFDAITGFPKVELKSGRTVVIAPETWELHDGEKKRAEITQIPLRLAWAITVHKSQGMTLDRARIDLSKAFVEGMGYVALSRVKELKSLYLIGINKTALRVSDEALKIDQELRESAVRHTEEHDHLRLRAQQRAKRSPAKAADWAQKLTNMRGEYPNAYKPWSAKDDEELVAMFVTGDEVDITLLTKKFGRHSGSIKARLKKHFGDDVVITRASKP